MEFQKKVWKESSEDALKKVQESGVEVIYPDKTPFREAVEKMYESYKGTPLYDLIKEIKAVD